ncbi:MAG: glycosyltransferase [Candidatus Rifleibacteriota bacterium]
MTSVSVIVPVYNAGRQIYSLLEHLAGQIYDKPFEVVLVDDGSNPELDIAKDFSSFKLRVIRLDPNQGPAAARNAGIKASNSEIIVFTDADCQPEPYWLGRMVAPFADKKVTGVKGAYKTTQSDFWARLAQIEFLERYDFLMQSPDIDFIDTYSAAYRREDLDAVKGFDTELITNEDVDLSFRIKARGGKFIFIPEAIVEHRHREGWINYARLKYGRAFWRMKVYLDHPKKLAGNSYTPDTLKAQLVLVSILPFILFFRNLRSIWKVCWLFSCLPLLKIAWKQSAILFFMVPVFCFVRSVALLAGIVAGVSQEKDGYLKLISSRLSGINN